MFLNFQIFVIFEEMVIVTDLTILPNATLMTVIAALCLQNAIFAKEKNASARKPETAIAEKQQQPKAAMMVKISG